MAKEARKRARARFAARAGALCLALAAGVNLWLLPQARAAEPAKGQTEECTDASVIKPADAVGKFRMFGLHLDMTEKDATCLLGKLSSGAACADAATTPGPDAACWTTTAYRESERAAPGRKSMALRSDLPGQWSALLRVYFTGPAGGTFEAKSDAPSDTSTVYRIEWSVYWSDKDLWLMSVRERMRDRVLASVKKAVPKLPRTRRILDEGLTHHYEWKAPAQDEKLKSFIAFDISYAPQLILTVARGEYMEVYAPRVLALDSAQKDQTSREDEVQDFLSTPKGDLPRLPLPEGMSP